MKANYLMIALLLVIIFFLTAGNVLGTDFRSGNDLLTICRNFEKETTSVQEAYETGFCQAYIRGVTDEIPKVSKCIPSGVTYEQIWRVVIKYLQNHPERLHLYPAFLIREALEKAFPCKQLQ